MATETVTLTERRFELARDALLEMLEISDVLMDVIDKKDSNGEIRTVARCVLIRVHSLSDAVFQCIDSRESERSTDADLFKIIEGRHPKPSDLEVSGVSHV